MLIYTFTGLVVTAITILLFARENSLLRAGLKSDLGLFLFLLMIAVWPITFIILLLFIADIAIKWLLDNSLR